VSGEKVEEEERNRVVTEALQKMTEATDMLRRLNEDAIRAIVANMESNADVLRSYFAVAPREESRRSAWPTIWNVVKGVGSLAGIIATIAGLVFLLNPNLLPWTTFRADISEARVVEHNVTLEDFKKRDYLAENPDLVVTGEPPAGGHPNTTIEGSSNQESQSAKFEYAFPEEPGATGIPALSKPPAFGDVIGYKLEIEGFQSKQIKIEWSMYDETGQSLPNPALNEQEGYPIGAWKAERRLDTAHGDIFVPLPDKDGTYFVVIEAWTHQGVRLDSEKSHEFEVVEGRWQAVSAASEK
jgi:hypothetical protein